MPSYQKRHLINFCLIILISFLGIFILNMKSAQAIWPFSQTVDSITLAFVGLLGGLLLMIQSLIGSLAAWFAGLAVGILSFTDPQNAQIVEHGWRIIRDLVNMFFVLILLFISLATILRLESHGIKALLPKLIIVALLINFSLVLTGVVIDFSNALTVFFISDGKEFVSNIADSMGLPKTTAANVESAGVDWNAIKEGSVFWKVITALILSIIFTTIAAFIFGAFAFMLLARVLIIWFLLILAPLAWFFAILPATRRMFNQWWSAFIKWVFFAPAAVFFIYLSVNAWSQFAQGDIPAPGEPIAIGMDTVITDQALKSSIMPQVMEPANLIQFLLACGMLIGSLIVAQKMGAYGATGAINIGKKWSKGAGNWTKQRSVSGAKLGWGTLGTVPGLNKIPKVAEAKRAALAGGMIGSKQIPGLEKMPLFGRTVGGPGAYAAKQSEKLKDEMKKLDSFAPTDLQTIAKKRAFTPQDQLRKAAAFGTLAKKGKLKGDYKANKNTLRTFEKTGGNLDDVFDKRPDWLNNYEMDFKKASPEQAAKKLQDKFDKLTSVKASDIQTESFKNPAVQEAFLKGLEEGGKLGTNHLTSITGKNPTARQEIDKQIFAKEENWERIRPKVREWLEEAPGNISFYEAPQPPPPPPSS